MKSPVSFGERLRAERERAGVSLDTIVEITKIKRSLLVGLENNDVSHWPSGIFRRAFLREYLGVIGIRSEAVVSEFLTLFPEPGESVPEVAAVGRVDGTVDMRLRLAEPPFLPGQNWKLKSAAAAADLAAVVILSFLVVLLLRMPGWPAMAVVGFLYYGASVAWLGLTPGLWWFFGDRSAFRLPFKREPIAEVPPLRIVVVRQPEESVAPAASAAETNVA